MDKVYKKYREMKKNPQKLMDELGIDLSEAGDNLGMGVVRKETDLNNDERQFLLAVERGDIPTARHFLEESQIYFNININCVDPLGRTALLIAIENENIEMIEILLTYSVELGDALLHAINEENVEAVNMLLNHQSSNRKNISEQRTIPGSFMGGVPSSSFTPDITPIILAAHRDNYEIIKILLDRGDRIPKPHDVRCSCIECVRKSNEDSLNLSRSRINAYRALSSPSLIALSSKDPILTAFELSWELKRLSRLENEFKLEYESLAKQCQEFAVALLDQTRGSKELEIILNHETDGPAHEEGERMNLTRLKLAIKYKQKKFVAHPNCQQLLASLWYEGLPGFRRRHVVFKVLLTVSVCLLYPVLSIFYMFLPKNAIGRFMRRPFIKFICHSASYMTFLFLLILASQRIESVITLGTDRKITREVRGAEPTSIEWMILAYVLGLVWQEVKQLWSDGAKAYVQDMWNILDFVTNSLYIATYTLKLVAYINVRKEKAEGKYILQPRSEWDAYDPNLISEGLFAAANIFSSLKLIYIFTVNPHLGPLQISLGRMVMDLMKFAFIAVLVVFAYACGVNQLYWYYATQRGKSCAAKHDSCDAKKWKAISNLWEILQTLYFSLFGLVELDTFNLKEKHDFTQFVGKTMFGTYSFISIIVLMNMLIAMLSNSYQIISSDSDAEWKYARSRLWMSYFEDGGTLPPPFNVIPSPKTFYYMLLWLKDKMCRCSQKAKRSKWQSIRKLMKQINERDARYQAVMRDLVKRYIMAQQRGSSDQGVTEDDLNEIKQDISSFRYELLEILRSNGMKMLNAQNQNRSNKRLGRKGSRLSIERYERRPKMEALPEKAPNDVTDLPAFLRKQSSFDSSQSNDSKQDSNDTGSLQDGKMSMDFVAEMNKKNKEKDMTKSSLDSSVVTGKRDEGLGESFDQQSEDSSYKSGSGSGNGHRNSAYDPLPEEKISEDGSIYDNEIVNGQAVAVEGTDEGENTNKNNSEITLDPTKLEGLAGAEGLASFPGEDDMTGSPFNKPAGAIKKVSFLWGNQKDAEESVEPVSETYLYEGKPSRKFRLWPFSKKQ